MKKYNMFIENQFQTGKLDLPTYKSNVENTKRFNDCVLQFYEVLENAEIITILKERL